MSAEELFGNSELDLSTEMILENFILYIVSHFCVGTEMRHLDMKIECETWLAKAAEVAHIFLPPSCPLVNHLTSSFNKLFQNRRPKPKSKRPAKRVLITLPVKLSKSNSNAQLQEVNLLTMYKQQLN